MNKNRQQVLVRWLKSQSALVKRWLRLSLLLGLLSGLVIVAQAWVLAHLLQALIIEQQPRATLAGWFIAMAALFIARALAGWLRERVGFIAGQALRREIRRQVLDRLELLGPAWIQGKPAGSWSSLLLEQIEDMQDYYARYLPQMYLAGLVPLLILIVVFPVNWMAGLILFCTAPLIPLFMALVGMGAADANRRNFLALARLSGYFLDRLRGLDTLRLFDRAQAETDHIRRSTNDFRLRTMEVLRLAFLSSGVLEFFASISIAVVAVYFGFSYLGELHFGSYGNGVTLFAGFLVLILAPEFFQPLRDLGAFYHAKAQAVGAAESLVTFLDADIQLQGAGTETPDFGPIGISAEQLVVMAPDGTALAGPLNFTLNAGRRLAIVGQSGAGKSSLLNVLLGFLPYRGSLRINGHELRDLSPPHWRRQLSWISQNPFLPAPTLRDNILLGSPDADESALAQAIEQAYVSEFLPLLPLGLDTPLGDNAARLSVGQAQRVALARALLQSPSLMLLDEPTASLDAHSEGLVTAALDRASRRHTTVLVTHQLGDIRDFDDIWVMGSGQIVQQGRYAQLAALPGPFADLLAHRRGEL
ncbi:heme ABC transporter permease/ATP-binding protein CydD [Acerihabitans arboris]|uniref:Cysteine/glutathione ABC transporter permease/ATP-binding protein CydD n=1 Tax=Acerihabitans arboris TaxID=2691583 RepID=A0A845SDA9_9GAMM|nr:cysteine/glutathione ABC transporter permease/ATP-binding protein CydD [Acerihabitans arboris]NDL62903.1 cysteine/glutathione ABC transporter permease/ATP-binding protein CydD [Acerihabitans arboris]